MSHPQHMIVGVSTGTDGETIVSREPLVSQEWRWPRMASIKVMDLFCGTGGFSKGFENTGAFSVVYGMDVLPVGVETFRLNHSRAVALEADIRDVRPRSVSHQIGLERGEVDVIIGGPPCQGFSSIRPFRSAMEDDPRNSLFEEFAAYVNYFRPQVFVMENVVGLATHKQGTTIEQIQDCFHGLGYTSDWRIINAAHFGVPQKRERLVMIGAQHGARAKFPSPTHAGDFRTIGVRDPTRRLAPPPIPDEPGLFVFDEPKLPDALTAMEAIGRPPPRGRGPNRGPVRPSTTKRLSGSTAPACPPPLPACGDRPLRAHVKDHPPFRLEHPLCTATPDHVGILIVLFAPRTRRACRDTHSQLRSPRFQQMHPPIPGPCPHTA